ncbi:aldo/keto reductase [Massilia cavernae]|uniref:Aldo/keto reductase n=1 Tax=Massilia cavernae TaxID=2320864 RepID=A0A418Y688_9BURK|nr:aldo/keto reductase [Massilia cavernae]RJG23211.1 aldo/keto reductase [Massilia cavernae]
MHRRILGKTGLRIAEVGYGAWGIGNSSWLGANDAQSAQSLHRAMDLGVNFVDTALVYGNGASEALVGAAVRARSESIYVASKIPPKNMTWPPRPDVSVDQVFPASHVIASTEQSLRNLGLERIDIQQFHVWDDTWCHQGDWLEAIAQLKRQGKIAHFGVSLNDHDSDNALALIETGLVDTVQVIYNIFEQTPNDRLFPACVRNNVGVIVRVALDEGGLTGAIDAGSAFPDGDFRNDYFRGERRQQVADRVGEICTRLGIEATQMAETALRFVLSNPAVSVVIPGMRSLRNVDKNCAVADGLGLPAAQLDTLARCRWIRNFYQP